MPLFGKDAARLTALQNGLEGNETALRNELNAIAIIITSWADDATWLQTLVAGGQIELQGDLAAIASSVVAATSLPQIATLLTALRTLSGGAIDIYAVDGNGDPIPTA